MISLSLSASAKALAREIKGQSAAMRKAAVRAVNATAAKSRTFSSRQLRATLNLKAARVNEVLKVSKTSTIDAPALLRVRRRAVPASYYNGWKAARRVRGRNIRTTAKKSAITKRAGAKGVTVRFEKGKPALRFPRGFVAVTPTGHLGLFQRVGKEAYPIKEIFGPNVQRVFVEQEGKVLEYGYRELSTIFDRELNYILSKK